MRNKYRAILFILFVFFCYGLTCHASSLPRPKAKLTIKVIDEETGLPIQNAIAGATFRIGGWDAEFTRVEGPTDKTGRYTVTGKGSRKITYGARHNDYYSTGLEYNFNQIESFTQLRHSPWNPELIVKLRKKKNPVPMIALRVTAAVPELNKELGFDLIEADWVAPCGKGKVSDFIFQVKKDFKSKDEYSGEMIVTFSNKFDGIYTYPVESNYPSELKLPHLAPDDGYERSLLKYERRVTKTGTNININKDQHYYFRIRSEEDEEGNLKRAMYGKIHGDILLLNTFSIVKLDRNKPQLIRFDYYFNPDYTRNTEYKYKSNLYKKGVTKSKDLTVEMINN
ncbi:MAG: hypothetical protein KKE17_09030 [Proteobacteria bacterium]|nr:hypothetical protein [Pseudomonadota bacterium]MBU1710131.1 hypothetical protein [Pseudomonadota bacterium]